MVCRGAARVAWHGGYRDTAANIRIPFQKINTCELIDAFHLPEKNEFIPTNFETNKVPVPTPQKMPHLIENSPSLRLWHKKDDTFWLPKANVWILFRNPLAYATPSNCVKTRLALIFAALYEAKSYAILNTLTFL